MKGTIAVEGTLSPVADILRRQGYQVIDTEGDISGANVIVVSGLDDNLTGRQDMVAEVPVINADVQTPKDVLRSVKEKLSIEQ
ncbi:MAG: YkuS family protein [Bacillota bacterium]